MSVHVTCPVTYWLNYSSQMLSHTEWAKLSWRDAMSLSCRSRFLPLIRAVFQVGEEGTVIMPEP